jgi:hypothetical protein
MKIDHKNLTPSDLQKSSVKKMKKIKKKCTCSFLDVYSSQDLFNAPVCCCTCHQPRDWGPRSLHWRKEHVHARIKKPISFFEKKTFGFPKNHRFLKKSNGYRFLLSNLKFEFSIKNQKPVNYLINQKNRLIFNKTNRFLIF